MQLLLRKLNANLKSMLNKFKPESPDPFLKNGEDMAPAKFGHLNEIVREINAGGGGGGVTSVTATAPCVSSGGATPAISIAKADATTDGYCSAADFAIFNGKQDQILLTATATLTAANIIAGASVTILPAPAATKYYVIHSLIMKFKGGSVAFDQGVSYRLFLEKGVTDLSGTPAGPLQAIAIPTNTTDAFLYWGSAIQGVGQAVSANWDAIGSLPAVGDSDVVFDITYELKDF